MSDSRGLIDHRLLLEHTPVLCWSAGPDGSRDYVNQTWLDFTGRTLEDELGFGFADCIHPDDRQRCLEGYRRRVGARAPYELEYRLRRRDGVYRVVIERGVPYEDESGRFLGFVGSCLDVHDRLETRDQERRAGVEREELIESLTKTVKFSELFVGILGHDLRNPLAGILSAAQLLQRRLEEREEPLLKPLMRILNSGERMARMIDQLLDFTRLRLGGGIPLERGEVDLADVCRAILEELSGGGEWGLQLDLAGDSKGEWDPDRIAQVVSNLAGNALQHGGGAGRVRIDGTHADRVVLSVHNRGAIPAAQLQSLFEPFGKSEGLGAGAARTAGLGLGLFITREIVRAHHGRLEVRSTEADGTTFVVELPRRTPTQPRVLARFG